MEFNEALHKVLLTYETQMHTDKEGIQFDVFIPFSNLEDFTETLSCRDFDDCGVPARIVQGNVCVSLRDLFEYNEYKLKDYTQCFSAEDFYEYQKEIQAFDGEN